MKLGTVNFSKELRWYMVCDQFWYHFVYLGIWNCTRITRLQRFYSQTTSQMLCYEVKMMTE